MKIIGLDPGKRGGVAIVSFSMTGLVMATDVFAMPPSAEELAFLLDIHQDAHVFLEKGQAMPKNGAVSMFNYGHHCGEIRGVLAALHLVHSLVPPQTWTRVMHVGCSAKEPKRKSLQAVRRLFPGQKLTIGDRATKEHDGVVDALLLTIYGHRVLSGRIA